MARHVFILGAGASVEAGGPVMSNFLDRAEDLSRKRDAPIDHESFRLAFEGLAALQAAHSKAQVDTLNIENVFGAFEVARLVERLDPLSPEEVHMLPGAITKLIVETIESGIRFTYKDRLNPDPSYASLAKLLDQIRGAPNSGRAAVITFNYDIALDHALHFNNIPYDYRTGAPTTALHQNPIDVLKLHGSVNWYVKDNALQALRVRLGARDALERWFCAPDKQNVRARAAVHRAAYVEQASPLRLNQTRMEGRSETLKRS
jgi:hypothetical protein